MGVEMNLTNAVERNRLHPDTFYVPPEDERRNLKVGDFAKLGFEDRERMWVLVTGKEGDLYFGLLSNTPMSVDMKYGDKVEFEQHHIMDILSKGEQ